MGGMGWGICALHRPHGSQGCTAHVRAKAVAERLARARFADSSCALAVPPASAWVGGEIIEWAFAFDAPSVRLASTAALLGLWPLQGIAARVCFYHLYQPI